LFILRVVIGNIHLKAVLIGKRKLANNPSTEFVNKRDMTDLTGSILHY
jgi:hypothetical protein